MDTGDQPDKPDKPDVPKPPYQSLSPYQKQLLKEWEIDYQSAPVDLILSLPILPDPESKILAQRGMDHPFILRHNLVNDTAGEPRVGGNRATPESITQQVAKAYKPSKKPTKQQAPNLSAEQLAAANVLLDFSDHRSQAAKLRSLGIPTVKYNNWLRNPAFREYLTVRAEYLLDSGLHEAHTSLLKNVQKGNQRSIEFFYEITGRYAPQQNQDSMNIAVILVRVVEAIQRHIKDPEIIKAIAQEFNEILPADSFNEARQPAIGRGVGIGA